MNLDDIKHAATKEELDLIATHKPRTLYAASRIPGIRPTTLISILYLAKKHLGNEPKIEAVNF